MGRGASITNLSVNPLASRNATGAKPTHRPAGNSPGGGRSGDTGGGGGGDGHIAAAAGGPGGPIQFRYKWLTSISVPEWLRVAQSPQWLAQCGKSSVDASRKTDGKEVTLIN